MDYPIRITTFCKCGRLTVTIATEYKVYNQDNTLHTCRDIMVDSKTDLTFKDCSEYTRCGFGDESISRCKLTGHCCEADEAGEQCNVWEEEKAEILKEGLTLKDIDIAIDKIKQDGTDMFYGDTYVLL